MNQQMIDSDARYRQLVDSCIRARFRVVTFFGTFIYLIFSFLDFQVYPVAAPTFLKHRIAVSALVAIGCLASFSRLPSAAFVWMIDAVVVLVCGSIAVMIYMTDGVASLYYQGLNIVLLAMVTVNCFRMSHNLVVGGLVIGMYAAAAALNPTPFSAAPFAAALFFMVSTLFFVAIMTRMFCRQHRDEHDKSIRLEAYARELDAAQVRQKATERLKDEFFANVSHELRTPLMLVLGPLRKQLGREPLDEADCRRDLAVAEKNTVLLLKHVNQLLDLSKLDAGKMDVAYADLDLAHLVRYVASHFDIAATERGIAFAVEAPAVLTAQADPVKVERILFNLLSNAFKFVPPSGSITCRVEEDEDQVRLSVIDDGPGIPAAMRQQIFERFRQLDGSITRRHGGTGLGLAIAAEFTKLHRGTIDVTSAEPHGAVFSVRLPRRAPAGTAVTPSHVRTAGVDGMTLADEVSAEMPDRSTAVGAKTAPVPSGKALPSVLVVEDNHEMNRFVSEAIGGLAQVERAYDGLDGLQRARDRCPDLIITDVMMPGMSGIELVAAAQADPTLRDTPVIVLTAKADDALRDELLRQGAHDYLYKPFSTGELLARVTNVLAMKRARDLLRNELSQREGDLVALVEALAGSKRATETALATATAAARAKDEFLMSLSHELRTPLTSILGWSDLLEQGDEVAVSVGTGIKSIRRNADALLSLVNDLLDLSQIVQGHVRLDTKPTDVKKVMDDVISALAVATAAKNLDVSSAVAPDVEHICCDPERLRQILWNLLTNAVKFTPAGGSIRVRAFRHEGDVVVEVADTGLGISPDFLPHVFDRLSQEDSSASKPHGGMGLGLSIVRHLVELHGGSVKAASDGPGRGATFAVGLPAEGFRPSTRPRASERHPETP